MCDTVIFNGGSPSMKKQGKTRLVHARMLEHESLDLIIQWFHARYKAVFGRKATRKVPVALALDFAVDLAADLIANPDLFIASESVTLANMSEVLTVEVQKKMAMILKGLDIPFDSVRTPDGGCDWTVYRPDGQPSALVKMGPEVFKSAKDGGDTRRKSTAPDRDMAVN